MFLISFSDGLDVLQYVYHLSKVNRFDVALMFLSSKEKQG